MTNNNTILSHEGKIHGKIEFPYAVYLGRIPYFLKSYPLHWHEEFEIIFITDGNVQIQVHCQKYNCSQGDIILIPPGAVHQIQQIEEKSAIYFNILFKFELLEPNEKSYIFKKYFLPLQNENGIINHVQNGTELNNKLSPILNHLIVNREKKYKNQELVIKANLFFIIEKLQDSIKKDSILEKTPHQISRLKPLLTYISSNYQNDISIWQAAELCSMSETYFMKFFKKMTGKTFIHYLNDFRLEKALQLLKNSSDSVSKIAEDTGFNNFSYFIRTFKKHFGTTPNHSRD